MNQNCEAAVTSQGAEAAALEVGSHNAEVEGWVTPNQNAEKLGIFYMLLYAIGTANVFTGRALD
jgi:hypothetical protein